MLSIGRGHTHKYAHEHVCFTSLNAGTSVYPPKLVHTST